MCTFLVTKNVKVSNTRVNDCLPLFICITAKFKGWRYHGEREKRKRDGKGTRRRDGKGMRRRRKEKEGEGGRTYFSIGVVAIVPHNFSFYTHLPHGICPC
jgi:hypothetical protein